MPRTVTRGSEPRSPAVMARLQALAGRPIPCVTADVRDVDEINACNIGVRALAAFPVKSAKRNTGQENVRLHFAGITVNPGDWIYADADGVIVSPLALS